MKILGIETSCDETAAAVVEDGTKILSNIVASSSDMHTKTGGIIPEQAARQQVISISPVMQNAMLNAKCQRSNIDAIAVTVGPGLIGSLLVGVETAKTLSYLWKKPIVPVNHLAAHIYANWLTPNSKLKIKQSLALQAKSSKLPEFPALALVVSGGHTDLVLMKDHPSASSGQANIKWIGGTKDDAAGEAFDKCARLLGLPYPGGPAISATAEKFQAQSAKLRLFTNSKLQMKLFPRPLIDEDNYDWSFSGLKTAVLREVKLNPTTLPLRRAELAAQVQEAIVDVLVEKTLRAVKKFKPGSLILAGGVAANKRLKEKFTRRIKDEKLQVYFHVPPTALCTDNASYIASYAFYNYKPVDWKKVNANPGLTIVGEL